MSEAEIHRLDDAEKAAQIADPQTASSAASVTSFPSPRLREAASEMKQQARAVAGQVGSKAKEAYGVAREMAGQRAAEGRTAIVDRPYAAVGAVFLIGVVLGHVLGARGPKVVYLRDPRRP